MTNPSHDSDLRPAPRVAEETSDHHRANEQQAGDILARARQQAGLTIEGVASQMRLPRRTIELLEANEFAALGPSTYARGYLVNYSRLLGLEPSTVLRAYKPDTGQRVTLTTTGKPPTGPRFEKAARVMMYAACTVLVVGSVGWQVAELMERRAEPAAQVQTEQSSDEMAPVRAAMTPRMESRSGDDRATSAPVDQGRSLDTLQATTPPQQILDESMDSTRATQIDSFSAPMDQPDANGDPQISMPVDSQVAMVDTGSVPDQVADRLELTLRQDSWVEIHDAAGQRLEYDMLRAEQPYSYSGQAPFDMVVGKAGGARVLFNDQPLDISNIITDNVLRGSLPPEES